MTEKAQIEQCYRRMYEGMIKKDGTILREVLAPAFVLIHMSGMRQPLDEFIRALLDGTLNYSSAQHQEMIVQVQDRHAELVGKSLVEAAVLGGCWHTWRHCLNCQLIANAGKWQITLASASVY